MKLPTIIAFVAGSIIGGCSVFVAMRHFAAGSEVITQPTLSVAKSPSSDPFDHDSDPTPKTENQIWEDWLSKLSGKWVSADGQQTADLDFRVLRFGETTGWPEVSRKTFLLGREMDFMSSDGSGSYTISTVYAEPNTMQVIREQTATCSLTGFTLYRDGTPRARSRLPVPKAVPPPEIQVLLGGIRTIKVGESKGEVLKRLSFADIRGSEVIDWYRGLGDNHVTYDLGVDGHWMLRLSYHQKSAVIGEDDGELGDMRVFRGYVDDFRKGISDIEDIVYPYYENGYVITGPNEAEQAGGGDGEKPAS